MSTYYEADDVKQHGTKVLNYPANKSPKAQPKGRYVAILDNGVREIAVDVTKPENYEYFYGQYAQGFWLRFDLYDYTLLESGSQ